MAEDRRVRELTSSHREFYGCVLLDAAFLLSIRAQNGLFKIFQRQKNGTDTKNSDNESLKDQWEKRFK
jgi:hypothetical protein